MNTNTIDIARLQRLLSDRDMRNIQEVLFYKDDDGSYRLFEQYTIMRKNKAYTVYKYNNPVPHQFSALKYALCYCINSKRNKIHGMQQILELDRKLTSLDIDIQIQRRLINNKVEHGLHETKLHESTLRRASIATQLQRYVDESDRWQTSKFGQSVKLHDK